MARAVDLAPEGAAVLLRVETEHVLLEPGEEGLPARGGRFFRGGERVAAGDEAFSDLSVHRVQV